MLVVRMALVLVLLWLLDRPWSGLVAVAVVVVGEIVVEEVGFSGRVWEIGPSTEHLHYSEALETCRSGVGRGRERREEVGIVKVERRTRECFGLHEV